MGREHPPPRPRPRARGRGWLNTGGDVSLRRPARPLRAARLLDLLLRQLPARPRRAAAAGGDVRRRARRRRRALPEVRARGRPGGAGAGRRALRRASTPSSTTRSSSPGRPTPPGPGRRSCSSTRRATSSRSTPARATRTRSSALLAELVEEHRARGTLQPGGSPYVAPPVGAQRPAVPGQGDRRCPAAASWSRTPATTSSSSWPRTPRPSYAGSGRASAGSSTAPDGPSTSRTGCACCPPTWPPRSGTTSWSPTP